MLTSFFNLVHYLTLKLEENMTTRVDSEMDRVASHPPPTGGVDRVASHLIYFKKEIKTKYLDSKWKNFIDGLNRYSSPLSGRIFKIAWPCEFPCAQCPQNHNAAPFSWQVHRIAMHRAFPDEQSRQNRDATLFSRPMRQIATCRDFPDELNNRK